MSGGVLKNNNIYSIVRKIIPLFLLSVSNLVFAQDSFQKLEKKLENRITYSDFRNIIDIVNQNRKFYNTFQRAKLDVIKLKALPEANLYEEAFKLSQELIAKTKLTAELKARVYVVRAMIFEVYDKPVECKNNLDSAEKIYTLHPELKPKNYTDFLIRKSSYYRMFIDKDIAFGIANEAKIYCEQVKDSVNLPVVELILGIGEKYKGNLDKAIKHFKTSIYFYKKFNNKMQAKAMYLNIAQFYYNAKDYKLANLYSDSAINTTSNIVFYDLDADAYEKKSKIMEQLGKIDSAFVYFKLSNKFALMFADKQRELKVEELNYRYNLEFEKSQKKQLENNVKLTKKANVRLFVFLIILIGLTIGLMVFLFILMKNRKKIENQRLKIHHKNEALSSALSEKQFLVEELNHRVKNNLSVILSLIGFQKDEADDFYKSKFDNLYQRIKTIALAHDLYSYSVNNNDHSLIELKDYTHKIFEAHQYSSIKNYTYQLDAEEIALKVDKVLPIGLILNELVTNSLKYAKPENEELLLKLSIVKLKNSEIKIEYFDNGKVFKLGKSKSSLGMFIIEGMVKQLRGTLERKEAHYKIFFSHE